MREYSDSEFEKKLMLLKNTHGLIKSLSKWCLERHKRYKSIISVWYNAVKKARIEKRLTLFYLANDILRNSKITNYKFIDGWATTIKKSIPYVSHGKIRFQIAKIIKIWEKYGIYDNSYLADLTNMLTTQNPKLKLADPVQEFQVQALAVKIRSCVKLEQITDLQIKNLREANLPLTNNEALQNMLKKVRTPSHEFLNELNDDVSKIQSSIKCIQQETINRAQLINALEVATSYYAAQNEEVKIVAQAYLEYTKRLILHKYKLQYLIGSTPTDTPTLSPDIKAPLLSTSSVSIEDLNINTVLINSELCDPASVCFPAIKNHDQQSLTSQFPYDAPSQPPDETYAFTNQTNVSNTNMNNYNKSSVYSTSSYEVSVPTPMSSSQQLIISEFSNNMVPPTNTTSLINEKTKPVFHVPQRVWDINVHSDRLTNERPSSLPFHKKISYQNTSIISKTDGKLGIDHCILPSKIIERDERVSRGMITKTSNIDYRNLIDLTHGPDMNSSGVSVNVDYRTFPDISIPPPSLDFPMEAVSKPPKNNVESVDMNLSENDEIPKSNQYHLPPMPFVYDQQCVPDVTNQWEQPSQIWGNDRPSFEDSQWDIEQYDQWKHPYQWEQKQNDSNFVLHRPQLQGSQHIQRNQSKVDFRPKWKRGISVWPRGPRNVIPHSTPTGRWNQGPLFGPWNQGPRFGLWNQGPRFGPWNQGLRFGLRNRPW
ncbi:regulation of nuclear pre-mRNA domain-containing protein 2-like isoform X2 [Acyrthosiphon pisum]|uniref:CID domain-containing protein n=1 Tax=Acyrthosiphon pisum TaxID=7029 RepID=A0A8R2NUW9_ACYPI|nr:regulation of nuclear pre-mRNA domain-containing protein 2-like isoform X2 [Acyrthosiphon pisum]